MNSKEAKGFHDFQQLVLDVTQEFKRISLSIIELEKKFRNQLQAESIADLVRNLQDQEKEKLHLTARLQMKMKELQDSPDRQATLEPEVGETKQKLKRIVENINETLEDIRYEIDL